MEVMKNKQKQQQQQINMSYTEFKRKERKRNMRKQHIDLCGSPFSKATSTGGKTESFYYWCNSKGKIPNYRAALPYISKGSKK